MTPAGRNRSPLGLIAGEGVFPFLVARGARAAGRRVVCCGFDGMADPGIEAEVDAFRRVSIARMGQWVRFLRRHDVREAIMVGRVKKQTMYARHQWLWILRQVPDALSLWLYWKHVRKDRRSDRVLQVIANALSRRGIDLIDSTTYTPDQLATEGVMTRRQPTGRQWADIDNGWEVCGQLTRLDIGQSIAVLDRDVLAVEATEGTDRMIDRAGELCRTGGWTMIKRANARGDMRLDVPGVGVWTIERLRRARAGCLCVEAGKVIILEKPRVLELANRYGIALVGRTAGGGAQEVVGMAGASAEEPYALGSPRRTAMALERR